jgi:hypothetical protein
MPRLTLSAVVLCAVIVMRYPPSSDSFAVSEQARVRTHLDSAERELRAGPVTGLSIAQRAARAQALDRLHAYAARGVFPRNRDFPGTLVPYFIDHRTGTRCAMAHLIEQSGNGGFVNRIAATNNNASIPDLKEDPELLSWLERNGLTLEEAARIQPMYGCGNSFYRPPCPPAPSASAGYKTTTGVSVGIDMVAVALNASPARLSRTLTGALGVAAGVVGIMIGTPNFNESGSRRTLGLVNAGTGAASAVLGVYRLTKKPAPPPTVSFGSWFSSSGAPGFSARVAF